MDAAERTEILSRYAERVRRFEVVASHLHVVQDTPAAAEIPRYATRRVSGREPTAREVEVLRLISDVLTNREIAKRLCLSEETVKTHARSLLALLQARSRAHAVAVGFRLGILS